MTTARKQINFGVPFTISVNNFREQEFEVLNFHSVEFDEPVCEIRSSTTYPPPLAYVTDKTNGIIKLVFHDKTPLNTSLELVVNPGVHQKVEVTEQKIMFAEGAVAAKAREAAAGSWRTLKTAFFSFVVISALFWFIKGSVFGDWIISVWSKINACQVIQMADTVDPRILTNNHAVYKTAAFTQVNAVYKEMFGAEQDLKKLYRFVGNGFFVTGDLIKNQDGSYMKLERDDAEEFCEVLAGRLLSVEELLAYLAGQYLTVENFIWPVSLNPSEPEWSGTKQSWDDYFVYTKESSFLSPDSGVASPSGFVVADEDDHDLAFRCGFMEKTFVNETNFAKAAK